MIYLKNVFKHIILKKTCGRVRNFKGETEYEKKKI